MPTPEMTERREGRVAGVVLAAGSSTRMGRNKLLLELDGEPLVRRAARRAAEAGLDPVIVVLGHEADRVRAALAGVPCLPIVNPDHLQGVRTSLQAGVRRAMEEDAAAIVNVLSDMTRVTAAMLAAVIERYRDSGAPLVVSRYGEVEAPPIAYDRSLFEELLASDAPGCGKKVVRRHLHEAAFLDWPEAALQDVDVAADYELALADGKGDACVAPAQLEES